MSSDILKHFEEKCADLPDGSLAPPTDEDDSDVRTVKFNNPKLMFGKDDTGISPQDLVFRLRHVRKKHG